MGQSAGHDGELVTADAERSALVASVTALISEWDGLLALNVTPADPRLRQLGERSTVLEQRSRSVGFGGVGHHLGELRRLLETSADGGRLRGQLEVVREMVQHAAQSLAAVPNEPPRPGYGPPGGAPLGSGAEPPPLLTMFRGKTGPSPAVTAPSAPPRPGGDSPPQPVGFAPPPLLAVGPQEFQAPALPRPEAPPALHNPAVGPPLVVRPPDPADPLRPDAPNPEPPTAVAGGGAGFAEAPRPAPFRPEAGQGPNLLVRSMLGLRAFGKSPKPKGEGEGAANAAPAQSLLGLKRGSRSQTPAANEPRRSHAPHGLGQHGGGPVPKTPIPHVPPAIPVAPPPLMNHDGRSGLPALPLGHPAAQGEPPRAGSSPNMREFFERGDRDSKHPRAPGAKRGRPRRLERKTWDWRLGALVGIGFFGLVAVIVALAVRGGRSRDAEARPAASGSSGAQAATSSSADAAGDVALPRSRLLNDNERFKSLLQQVHGRGKETPELRALLDEQASVAARALSPEGCEGAECAALAKMKDLVAGPPTRIVRRRRASEGWKSKWLAGLQMPEIAVEDDPRVQRRFEFYTENPVGRETFQQMLFRCGAHRDVIQTALIRRGLPSDLIAVAFAESGCQPLAKSPAGAEGLWQFIPAAARAYHLRIIEGVVDERHSPAKSTEAAVRYFSDLKAKLNDWDLCFAAYNMGPFGLVARIERAGGENIGFWDLVDSDLIPDETEAYAPSIQAIALILANLQKLKFAGMQMRAPQITADLEVPPSTRLGLIARAAATSVTELRRLNLDLKSDRTPNFQNFSVQVPKDVVWQARDTLQELLKNRDEADLCTPPGFDWGRQRFTQEMAKSCERTLATSPNPAPESADPGAAAQDGAD